MRLCSVYTKNILQIKFSSNQLLGDMTGAEKGAIIVLIDVSEPGGGRLQTAL